MKILFWLMVVGVLFCLGWITASETVAKWTNNDLLSKGNNKRGRDTIVGHFLLSVLAFSFFYSFIEARFMLSYFSEDLSDLVIRLINLRHFADFLGLAVLLSVLTAGLLVLLKRRAVTRSMEYNESLWSKF